MGVEQLCDSKPTPMIHQPTPPSLPTHDSIESIPSPTASQRRRDTDELIARKDREANFTKDAYQRQLAQKTGSKGAQKRREGYTYDVIGGTGWSKRRKSERRKSRSSSVGTQ